MTSPPAIPFHAQDRFDYCGVACLQMLFHWHLEQMASVTGFSSDQDSIFEDAKSKPNRTIPASLFNSSEQERYDGASLGPFQLARWLNQKWTLPTIQPMAQSQNSILGKLRLYFLPQPVWNVAEDIFDTNSEAEHHSPTNVVNAIEASASRGLPCIVLMFDRGHWVVCTEIYSGENQSRVFTFLDPWLERFPADGSDPQPNFDHEMRIDCPCGNTSYYFYRLERRRILTGQIVQIDTYFSRELWWREADGRKTISSPSRSLWGTVFTGSPRMQVYPSDQDGHSVGCYAVTPSVVDPKSTIHPRQALLTQRMAISKRPDGGPPSLIQQLQSAHLIGPKAIGVWADLVQLDGKSHFQQVHRLPDGRQNYVLHFFSPTVAGTLAVITTSDGWLMEAAILKGRIPDLTKSKEKAEETLMSKKTLILEDTSIIQLSDYTISVKDGLYWEYTAQSAVPYLPFSIATLVQKNSGNSINIYIALSGNIYTYLTPPGSSKTT